MDGEELTEQETALYDRQIRVWGADAQRRLSKSHILVSGLEGSVIEFCKNIVLAGVGSVTINDDRLVTEELLTANFLIPLDESRYSGRSLAELCCESLKDFNPMVRVSVEKGDLSSFGVDFFCKFDALVINCCSLATKKSVNEKCRKSLKRVAFYTVDCRDTCAEIFVDLQNYSYLKEKGDEKFECHVEYPSFEFEELEGRSPGETSTTDLLDVQKLKREICEANSVSESLIPDSLLVRLLKGKTEFPPVCAIIGGILGQEVIKAISGKGDPLKNFFFFDAMDGKGLIEDISKVKTEG
ncbi:SUMO-activating enzyme subunit 1B-1-like isoform X3 [Primulina huaijiensis]|uniref:SUMO-activating enzyme subunit 1B-1-like isoform X3 n=1 Tax=Primulina huaijiensis TaxID=1492673 RepID=UPI003CC773C0